MSICAPRAPFPPEPPAVVAPVQQLIGEYREWLVCERGLAPVTVRAAEQFARRFLDQRVDAGDPCGVLGITAGEVNGFLVRECARVSSGSAGCCTYRLRSLLRYLALRGVARTPGPRGRRCIPGRCRSRVEGAGERDPDTIADAEAVDSGAELVDDAGAIMVRNRRPRDLPAGRAAA